MSKPNMMDDLRREYEDAVDRAKMVRGYLKPECGSLSDWGRGRWMEVIRRLKSTHRLIQVQRRIDKERAEQDRLILEASAAHRESMLSDAREIYDQYLREVIDSPEDLHDLYRSDTDQHIADQVLCVNHGDVCPLDVMEEVVRLHRIETMKPDMLQEHDRSMPLDYRWPI